MKDCMRAAREELTRRRAPGRPPRAAAAGRRAAAAPARRGAGAGGSQPRRPPGAGRRPAGEAPHPARPLRLRRRAPCLPPGTPRRWPCSTALPIQPPCGSRRPGGSAAEGRRARRRSGHVHDHPPGRRARPLRHRGPAQGSPSPSKIVQPLVVTRYISPVIIAKSPVITSSLLAFPRNWGGAKLTMAEPRSRAPAARRMPSQPGRSCTTPGGRR